MCTRDREDVSFSTSCYRFLLRGYSRKFRIEAGAELESVFSDSYREARKRGRLYVLLLWIRTLLDLLVSVSAEKLERLHRRSGAARKRQRKWRRFSPGSFVETTAHDVRFALRTLRRRPLFATMAVLTLGLGIGATTSMFSVLHEVVLYRSPFRAPGRLVTVFTAPSWLREVPGSEGYWDRNPIQIEQYQSWRENTTQFEAVAVHRLRVMTLTGLGTPRRVMVGAASASLLRVLGVTPVLGRWFSPQEEGFTEGSGARVAVLSHEMWDTHFASRTDVVGETVDLDDITFTVVGVLPRGFRLRWLGHPWTEEVDTGDKGIWMPIGASGHDPKGGSWEAIGRLREGVTPERVTAETRSILMPDTGPGEGSVRIVERKTADTEDLSSPLILLFGSTGVLLLIACANVAILFAGEAVARDRELNTRYALGAGVGRIVTQLITESLLLGLIGAALGAVFAWGALGGIMAVAPPIPRVDNVGIDLPALLVATLSGLLAGIVSGTVPAINSARRSAGASGCATRTSVAFHRQPLQRCLVPGLIALVATLLVGAGLLLRSYDVLLTVDPGFHAENLGSVHLTLPESRYTNGRERWTFYEQLLQQIRAIPEVRSAGLASSLPFPGKNNINNSMIWKVGKGLESEAGIRGTSFDVTHGYLETLGVRLLAGRLFTAADDVDGEPVMIVNETLARRYWPNESPLGSRVRYWAGTHTIVGVVGDVKREDLASEPEPTYYVALGQRTDEVDDPTLLVRTSGDPSQVIPTLRRLIRAADGNVPVDVATTMTALVAASAADARYRALLMAAFGVLAVLLASTGVYGVTARTVEQRTRELGIQMALGATRSNVIAATVWTTVKSAGLGLLLGLALSLWSSRFLSRFLFEIEASDPATYGVVAALIASVCLLASYTPARRITTVNPVEALRAE